MRPRLLDAYCKAGGATCGYQRAGFHVTGIDIEPQPRYVGDEFIQADAMEMLADRDFLADFDVIHASPPCQAYSAMRHNWNARDDHPDLLRPTRDLLIRSGLSWVIENVPGAPMSPLVMLCGSAFGLGIPGYQLRRHRWFEISGCWLMSPPCQHRGPVIGIYGDHGRDRRRSEGYGRYFTLDERKAAMGIDWMARDELDQAIPPAYTEYIGQQLLTVVIPPAKVVLPPNERGTKMATARQRQSWGLTDPSAANPSWNLSRAVRATIICRGLRVNARTASRAAIEEVAGNMLANGHAYLEGYDVRTVRAILLDKTLGTSFPAEAPAKYAGK